MAQKSQPVVWWAWLGVALVIVMAYVIIAWVTGPNFKEVQPGASELPGGQKEALLGIQIGGCALVAFMLYWMLYRPWRREGVVRSEGLLLIAYATLYFQDPFTNAGNYWFIYNAELWNRGSWINEMPLFGGNTGEPGQMWAEPIFGMGPGYVYFWVIGMWAGMKGFKFFKQRFPQVGLPGALVACWGSIFIFDVVIEAFVWMRSGFFVYPGGRQLGTIFGESYLAFPFIEAVMIGVLLTPFVLMTYYKDDKGYTFAERGVDKLRVSNRMKVGIRLFALIAVSQVLYFFAYSVWVYHVGANATSYPESVQKRSMFIDQVCGEDNGRMCPGPDVPNSRTNSAFLDTRGGTGTRDGKGTTVPKVVPIDRGKPGGTE